MERVTFQDHELVTRIKETCVPTWTNAVPGFETASLDHPALGASTEMFAKVAAEHPGQASNNVATIFSTADRRVLHVAPGLLQPSDLLAQLEFALSVDAAVRAAGPDQAARERAYASKHVERLTAPGDDAPMRRLLTPVHRTLAERPLLALDDLRLADYTSETLDAQETLTAGRALKEQLEAASFERR